VTHNMRCIKNRLIHNVMHGSRVRTSQTLHSPINQSCDIITVEKIAHHYEIKHVRTSYLVNNLIGCERRSVHLIRKRENWKLSHSANLNLKKKKIKFV
jgi:hypothetical protein